jgi:hypothetical protein
MKGCPYCPAATRRAARKRFPGLKRSSPVLHSLSPSLSLSLSFSLRRVVLAAGFPRNRREELFQQIIAGSDRADRYRPSSILNSLELEIKPIVIKSGRVEAAGRRGKLAA